MFGSASRSIGAVVAVLVAISIYGIWQQAFGGVASPETLSGYLIGRGAPAILAAGSAMLIATAAMGRRCAAAATFAIITLLLAVFLSDSLARLEVPTATGWLWVTVDAVTCALAIAAVKYLSRRIGALG